MLHPSYSDLIRVVNQDVEDSDQLVQSRYSIVIATAKRARQIIQENKTGLKKKKALSIAIDEIYNHKVKIVLGEEDEEIALDRLQEADAVREADEISDGIEVSDATDGEGEELKLEASEEAFEETFANAEEVLQEDASQEYDLQEDAQQ